MSCRCPMRETRKGCGSGLWQFIGDDGDEGQRSPGIRRELAIHFASKSLEPNPPSKLWFVRTHRGRSPFNVDLKQLLKQCGVINRGDFTKIWFGHYGQHTEDHCAHSCASLIFDLTLLGSWASARLHKMDYRKMFHSNLYHHFLHWWCHNVGVSHASQCKTRLVIYTAFVCGDPNAADAASLVAIVFVPSWSTFGRKCSERANAKWNDMFLILLGRFCMAL